MAETVQVFTLNDFPTEIIERFAPDLRPRTVSTLRLVSPRFRDVFTSDHYYRSYLCYQPEFYLEDLEGIGEARDRWMRCLEAEKKRLDNWRHGRCTRVETVRVPGDEKFASCDWQGEVGEGHNYFVMRELKNRKIFLANVTKDPIMSVIDVSCHTTKLVGFSKLLADQVLIISGDGSTQVLNVLKDESKLDLQHFFTIKASDETVSADYITGMSNLTKTYRNLYVRCFGSGLLRVWDLKSGASHDSTVVIDHLPPNLHAESFFKWIGDPWSQFPYVILIIRDIKTFDEVYYLVVNLDENRVACSVAVGIDFGLNRWFVKGHELSMLFINNDGGCDIRNYDLRPHSRPGLESQPIFHQTLTSVAFLKYEPPWLVYFFKNKMFVTNVNNGAIFKEIEMDKVIGVSFDLRAVVPPFIVGEDYLLDSRSATTLFTWDAAGDLVFAWRTILKCSGVNVKGLSLRNLSFLSTRFRSLSKCVLQNIDGDILYICNF